MLRGKKRKREHFDAWPQIVAAAQIPCLTNLCHLYFSAPPVQSFAETLLAV